ncbi:hypothetical protein [Microbulbifer rhizosphaerae]|uniref:Uncharacterized protein n=1 Tax=Microbulbifer rhizosphaerae TaxID=1562603 RepID=A0A7W4WAB4_9GAMM|nr:hypothetical protein [Microbulbifer rhizosphaerae]MBB3060587.1 hypothetical protein [Microbulbifer rhizosphaerae]
MKKLLQYGALLAALSGGGAAAEDVIELESTVIGNQEQPKVLYIIPWKQADSLARLDGGLPQTIGDVFAHRDYSEFQREIKLLRSNEEEEAN